LKKTIFKGTYLHFTSISLLSGHYQLENWKLEGQIHCGAILNDLPGNSINGIRYYTPGLGQTLKYRLTLGHALQLFYTL
jgi:hypothetical protein